MIAGDRQMGHTRPIPSLYPELKWDHLGALNMSRNVLLESRTNLEMTLTLPVSRNFNPRLFVILRHNSIQVSPTNSYWHLQWFFVN